MRIRRRRRPADVPAHGRRLLNHGESSGCLAQEQLRLLRSRSPLLALAVPAILMLGACGSDGSAALAGRVDVDGPTATATATGVAGDQPSPQFEATTEPTPASDPEADPTDSTDAPVTPGPTSAAAEARCDSVPRFYDADSVEVACADGHALSPELFANNAGWHLFEFRSEGWHEIDYALTCCNEPEEITLLELLERNGLEPATIDALCAATRDCAGGDPDDSTDPDEPPLEPTALRVNGFGPHDFGDPESAVHATLTARFGQPDDVVDAGECGAGPMTIVSYDDFSVNFQDGSLVGWYYTASDPPLTTPSGVAPGIDEAELRVVYPGVQIDETTLGTEFFFEVPAGFIGGFLEDDGSGVVVTSLYAGTTCFFR